MKLIKRSPFSGKMNSREIDITVEQLNDYYNSGKNIQDVFPHLSADDREFIMTGIPPEEFPGGEE